MTKAFVKTDQIAIREVQLKRLTAKLQEQLNEAYMAGKNGRNNSCADTANYLTGYTIGLFKLEDRHINSSAKVAKKDIEAILDRHLNEVNLKAGHKQKLVDELYKLKIDGAK